MPVIKTDGGRLIDYPEGNLRIPTSPQVVTEPIAETIHGHSDWIKRRFAETVRFHDAHKAIGQGLGYTAKEAERLWKRARKQAEKQMEDIKQKIDLESAAEEALTEALTVMRGPIAAKEKLAAARLVLDFTKAKPATKSEVTVNSAEEWLKSLTDTKD